MTQMFMTRQAEKQIWPGWCTLESEPAIFNQLLHDIGASGTQVEEVYSLDSDSLNELRPAHGLIFLFRWKEEATSESGEVTCPENVWFANQVTDNSCASLALLNIIYNCPNIPLGKELESFKDYSNTLTPPLKGLAVANFEYLRKIHNTFARKAEMEDSDMGLVEAAKRRAASGDAQEDNEAAYHFIAYVHIDGALWELDGLQRVPSKLHDCTQDEWTALAGPHIQDRIKQYPEGELMFNLLAVVPERVGILREKLHINELTIGLVEEQMGEVDGGWKERVPYNDTEHTKIMKEPMTWKDHLDDSIVDKVMGTTDLDKLWTTFQRLVQEQRSIKLDMRDQRDKMDHYRIMADERRQDYSKFVEAFATMLANKKLPRAILT